MLLRRSGILLALLLCGTALAVPPLTTIQDMLYKADGTPFSGTAFIEWKTFAAADSSNIATHRLTVPIVNGLLRVQLVPTTNATPAATYTVHYNSDGRVQFEETWAVPPSASVLRLKDVRIVTPPPITPPGQLTQIEESDVIGLENDLSARPVKGISYASSRAAVIGPSGTLEAALGNLADCVRVDGTSGPCGSGTVTGGPGFVDGEPPAGLVNGSNAVFTLAQAPQPLSSLSVYRNGLLQAQSADYSVSGNVITFTAASIPQAGDSLLATYRLADASNPAGQAGGALTGTYPNPLLAEGVIADGNVSSVAGIRESKLALNFPTHANTNDPTADQKSALGGTSGTASATNRYVTDQDPRMSDARAPLTHGLLSASHGDTGPAAPSRGDLIVGQGSAAWTRLPLGAANRCLMSNGSDAVWNTCLYTGFAAGSIPFVDSAGNLAQSARLAWNEAGRKLSIGNSGGAATLYVYDANAGDGTTSLTVRAGQGQGSEALQRWLDANGGELARVDAAGNFGGATFRAASSANGAAWQDAGSASDPSPRSNGDLWFHAGEQARKGAEAGQAHPLPQVICSSGGASSGATSATRLGSCTLPANFLKAGDRIDIRFDYSHEGAASDFIFEVRWGGSMLLRRTALAAESLASGKADAGVHGAGVQWSLQSWGTALALAAAAGTAADSLSAPLTVDFLGQMALATSDTVTLRNFTVIRYPAQANP